MTLTIDLTPDMETRLHEEAAKQGQAPKEYAQQAFEHLLGLNPEQEETEAAFTAAWSAASNRSLQEIWDNDEDAVYDHL